MFTHPVIARVIVDERQAAAIRRAADSRRASEAKSRHRHGPAWPIRPRGRPIITVGGFIKS